MNNERRKQIAEVIRKIELLKEEISDLMIAEEEEFESLPESLQDGEKGLAMQEAGANLESALGSLDEAYYFLSDAAE